MAFILFGLLSLIIGCWLAGPLLDRFFEMFEGRGSRELFWFFAGFGHIVVGLLLLRTGILALPGRSRDSDYTIVASRTFMAALGYLLMELLVEFLLFCLTFLAITQFSSQGGGTDGKDLRLLASMWLFVFGLRVMFLQIPAAFYAKYVLLRRDLFNAWTSALANFWTIFVACAGTKLILDGPRDLFGPIVPTLTIFFATTIAPFPVQMILGRAKAQSN